MPSFCHLQYENQGGRPGRFSHVMCAVWRGGLGSRLTVLGSHHDPTGNGNWTSFSGIAWHGPSRARWNRGRSSLPAKNLHQNLISRCVCE